MRHHQPRPSAIRPSTLAVVADMRPGHPQHRDGASDIQPVDPSRDGGAALGSDHKVHWPSMLSPQR